MLIKHRKGRFLRTFILGAILFVCWLSHAMIINRIKLIELFFQPMLNNEMGGTLFYTIIYTLFFISVIVLYPLGKRYMTIPFIAMAVYEFFVLMLPAFIYGTKFGSSHIGYYLGSMFKGRYAYTIKSLIFIAIFILLAIIVSSDKKKLRNILKIVSVVLLVALLVFQSIKVSSPTAFTVSFISEFFRLACLAVIIIFV